MRVKQIDIFDMFDRHIDLRNIHQYDCNWAVRLCDAQFSELCHSFGCTDIPSTRELSTSIAVIISLKFLEQSNMEIFITE
jgi:hypothetical protein